MVDIISPEDLASYLRDDSVAENTSLIQIVDLVNEVITEAWTEPEEPAPARVRLLALSVGARAWVNDPSAAHLSSTSVSADDGMVTDRYREPSRTGIYLTADEVALLNGLQRTRSVRLVTYGEV